MTIASLRQLSTTRNSNVDIGGNNITGTGLVSTADNSFREFGGQIAEWLVEMSYPTAGGAADALTLTPTTALAALAANQVYTFTAASTNITTTPTLAVSGLTAKVFRKIVAGADVAVSIGDIQAAGRYAAVYDPSANSSGGAWILINPNGGAIRDNVFTLQDNGDLTKLLQFQLSGITTGTTRTLTAPDADTTIVGTNATQTLTNKTLTAPTLTSPIMSGTAALASGFVMNWNSGDVTLTHSSNTLSFAGASSGYIHDTTIQVTGGTPRFYVTGLASGQIGILTQADTTGTRTVLQTQNSGGSGVGGITQDNTSTAFLTSSDYRLKQDVEPLVTFSFDKEMFDELDDALLKIMALTPVSYRWIADPDQGIVHGFIAHEAQAVEPNAVVGEKDAVVPIGTAVIPEHTVIITPEQDGEPDEEGNPTKIAEVTETIPERRIENVPFNQAPRGSDWTATGERIAPQGIDHSKMVPDIVAALQQATLMILDLRRRTSDLERR